MFKKILNLPNFITTSDIQKWIDDFYDFSKRNIYLFFSKFDTLIELEFSDDEPKVNSYVSIKTLNEVKKELLDLIGTNNRIKNAETIQEIWSIIEEIGIEMLAMEIESRLGLSMGQACDMIRDILDSYSSDETISYVAGEYDFINKKIILYNKVIQMKQIRMLEYYIEVFVHEMFHAFHYITSDLNKKDEIFARRDYTSKVVKESLASYFEFKFCENYSIATNVNSNWHIGILNSPYSGACQINDWQHFNKILKLSLDNMDDALRLLLPFYDFYKVKNALNIIEKTKVIPKRTVKGVLLSKIIPFGMIYTVIDKRINVYLLPESEIDFFEQLQKYHKYHIIVFYKDGTVGYHPCHSKNLNDITNLKSNIKTQSILKKSVNPRFAEIDYVFVIS